MKSFLEIAPKLLTFIFWLCVMAGMAIGGCWLCATLAELCGASIPISALAGAAGILLGGLLFLCLSYAVHEWEDRRQFRKRYPYKYHKPFIE